MSHDERRIQDVLRETPLLDQNEIITSDGTRPRVEYVGNIDVVFYGRIDEPITLCDVSCVPGLKFNIFRSTRHSRHMSLF